MVRQAFGIVWHDSYDIFRSNKCLQTLHQVASGCSTLHYCNHLVHSRSEGRAVYSVPRCLLKVAPAPHLQNTSSQWRQAKSIKFEWAVFVSNLTFGTFIESTLCHMGKTFHWRRSWSFSHPFPWVMSHDSMPTQLSDSESLRCLAGLFERSFINH